MNCGYAKDCARLILSVLMFVAALHASAAPPSLVRIASGSSHTVAVKADGTLWAWGYNRFYGEVGIGTLGDQPTPMQIGTGFKTVASGGNHSGAVKTDGSLWMWGYNYFGQLGDGSAVQRNAPVQVATGYHNVSIGGDHTLAIKSDGSLMAWGYNYWGELGIGETTPMGGLGKPAALHATPIVIDTGFVMAVASGGNSYAIKADGSLWGWGNNNYGQVGTGSASSCSMTQCEVYASPVKVDTGVASVAAAGGHVAAIHVDGSLWTWGYNGKGQLGDGTRTDGYAPVKIGTGYKAVAAGANHTLAIKTDGSLWAWGYNASGQLGDGTLTDRLIPVLIGVGFVEIAAGHDHSVAIKSDGSLWAWGNNDYGQVGDGSMTTRLVPVKIGTGFLDVSQEPVPTNWYLLGNGSERTLDVTALGDASVITSVWKWNAANSKWTFHAPSLTGQALNDYAAAKGYDVLTTIEAGEGYWVNAKTAFAAPASSGARVLSSSFRPATVSAAGGSRALSTGWNLVATGDDPTPAAFDLAIATDSSVVPPDGQGYANLVSLWAWEPTTARWYFWAPSLAYSGGLANYLAGKGHLDFSNMPATPAGTLSQATGFWVNMP